MLILLLITHLMAGVFGHGTHRVEFVAGIDRSRDTSFPLYYVTDDLDKCHNLPYTEGIRLDNSIGIYVTNYSDCVTVFDQPNCSGRSMNHTYYSGTAERLQEFIPQSFIGCELDLFKRDIDKVTLYAQTGGMRELITLQEINYCTHLPVSVRGSVKSIRTYGNCIKIQQSTCEMYYQNYTRVITGVINGLADLPPNTNILSVKTCNSEY